jgi:hypothetical protein
MRIIKFAAFFYSIFTLIGKNAENTYDIAEIITQIKAHADSYLKNDQENNKFIIAKTLVGSNPVYMINFVDNLSEAKKFQTPNLL